ncbi:hypothetical protein [Marinomonas posidonica]|uniref:DUF7217 family protein n=1 Tax=Marinomonas posidonica TaxID=936476 RepID=UPI003736A374
MSLDFSKGAFNAFAAGSPFESVTMSKATATNSQCGTLRTRLDKYLPAEGETIVNPTLPDATKVTNCQNALLNYGTGANTLNAHVQTRLDSLLDDLQVASAVKSVDSYLNDVPDSCANINTIMGTAAGATDDLLAASSDILNELDQGITDFDSGTMGKADFEDLLDRVTAELGSNLTTMLGMISNEVAMVQSMYDTHRQMAQSFKLAGLIDDPCVRPFLVRLAGPELSQVLVSNFGVGDIEQIDV